MSEKNELIVIGVAGGTGSGKTTVSEQILERVGRDRIAYIQHDSYYKELDHLPMKERAKVNFDHPDALDTDLFIKHLRKLRGGKSVKVPIYNFTTHTRNPEDMRRVAPQPIILVEGILIFVEKELRDLIDIKIYVDTDADIRFIRRLERDIKERGRSIESVIEQYITTVRPMHLEFVEPSKRYADIIIPSGGHNVVALNMVTAHIEEMLDERVSVYHVEEVLERVKEELRRKK